jgi:hypothetical protein
MTIVYPVHGSGSTVRLDHSFNTTSKNIMAILNKHNHMHPTHPNDTTTLE